MLIRHENYSSWREGGGGGRGQRIFALSASPAALGPGALWQPGLSVTGSRRWRAGRTACAGAAAERWAGAANATGESGKPWKNAFVDGLQ